MRLKNRLNGVEETGTWFMGVKEGGFRLSQIESQPTNERVRLQSTDNGENPKGEQPFCEQSTTNGAI